MTDTPLDFLRATLDEVEVEAGAARGGSAGVWSADCHPHYDGARVYDDQGDVVVLDEGSPSAEQATYIARHDPAATLRRIASERELLAKCEEVLAVDGWEYDDAPKLAEHVISDLAEGWGWTGETP